MKAYYLSYNHYLISETTARRLCNPIPGNGTETKVKLPNGVECWLCQTPHNGRDVWALYPIKEKIGRKLVDKGEYSLLEKFNPSDDECLFI